MLGLDYNVLFCYSKDLTMGCHLQHFHCGVTAICFVVCCCCFNLSFHAVHGLLAASDSLVKSHLEANGQVEAIGHLVKRELPEFNSTDTRDVSPVSFMESHSTPIVSSSFHSDLSATEPTHYQRNGTDVKQSLLHKLFEKYGENGVMTFDGFEQLLKNIGLKFEVKNDDVSSRNVTMAVRNHLASNSMLDTEFESQGHHHDSNSVHDHSSHEHLGNEMNAKSDAADLMQRPQSQNNTGTAEEKSPSFNEVIVKSMMLLSYFSSLCLHCASV